MSIEEARSLFPWMFLLNYLFLLLWAGGFILASDWMYRLHQRWFPMSRQAFNIIHYAGIGLYKILIILFVLIPWLALILRSI